MDIENTQMLKGLYGSQISKSKAVGYCKHHCAALTTRTLKQHECLKKQCNAFTKYDDHPIWAERARMKEIRRAKKIQLQQ